MDKQIIVGLDIGTTKIACLIGVRDEENKGKIKIIGHGKVASVGVEHGEVRNILDATESIKQAVAMAAEEANCSVKDVYVGIAGQHIQSQKNRGMISISQQQPFIEEKDVKRLIEEQYNIPLDPGVEIIHIFPQTYFVDNDELRDINPIGCSGVRLAADFHIVTGKTNNIKNIIASVHNAGLNVKGIVLEPIASGMAVLTQEDRDAGVALVDIGGGTTDVAIFTEGVIRHTHVIPLAGKSITEDIRKGCTVMPDTAERLKVQFGSCMPECVPDEVVSFPGIRGSSPRLVEVKTLANIIKARTNDIIDLVHCEIVESDTEKQLVGGIVLTGGGAKLKDIVNYTSYKTGIGTRIGTPDEHITITAESKSADISDPIYATGIGLVLYGFEEIDKEQEKLKKEKQPEPEPEPKPDDDKISPDILDETTEEPAPQPQPDEGDKKGKGGKGKGFIGAVDKWLKDFLKDENVD